MRDRRDDYYRRVRYDDRRRSPPRYDHRASNYDGCELAYRHTLEYIRAPSQKSLPLRCCVPGVTEKSHRSTQRALPQHREFHSLRARIAANQSTARRAGAARKKQQTISSKP